MTHQTSPSTIESSTEQAPVTSGADAAPEVPATYLTIPESNLDRLEDRVAKLNRRAAKLGLAAVEVTEISRETRRVYVGRNVLDEPVYLSRVWLTLDIQGDKPTVPGWTLVGAIDHGDVTDGSLNILRAGRDETVPESYRRARPFCGHCNTTRRRRDTFILRRENAAELTYDAHMQVGRNCLADFLGTDTTAVQVVGWLKFVREIEEMSEEYETEGYPDRSDYCETGRYLAAVAASVRIDGWASKGRVYDEGGTSTAEAAWSVLHPTEHDLKRRDHPEITPDDVETAEKALVWIRTLPENDRAEDYLANLYAACARDGFRTKQDGIVASLVGAAFPRAMRNAEEDHQRQIEAEERATKPTSHYVGALKERLLDVPVTIEKIRGWEGHYGYTTFIAMRDAENNLIVWYASGDIAVNLPAENVRCTLTGTVKKHDIDKYTGEACTHVKRCKLTA